MDSQVKSVAPPPRSQQILLKAVAEGCGRDGSAEFARFLQIASGSTSETEYLTLLAHDLKYLNDDQYVELMDTIVSLKKMLTALLRNVRTED